MYKFKRIFFYNLLFLLLLSACGSHLSHVVQRGETLYSISWMYGHDYQKVAQWNGIKPPYVIKPGERLRLTPGQNSDNAASKMGLGPPHFTRREGLKREPLGKKETETTAKLVTAGQIKDRNQLNHLDGNTYLKWQWPTRGGRIVSTFKAADPGKRGVDIAGNSGQAVMAAADGEVVYSGGGLPRYGKLIIVKHNDVYLSAYAHNRKLYVAEGDAVRRGQHIADMGSSGSSSIKLHFEIRRNGKAVDPLQLLPMLPKSKL